MAASVERIVVETTAREKRALAAKAKRLGIPIAELMRRGASTYGQAEDVDELGPLADAARIAATRAIASIDEALAFIDASNARISNMEAEARRGRDRATHGESEEGSPWV